MRLYQKESVWALLNPMVACGALWQNRRLLWQFTWRSVELQHKGSFLGIAWTLLNPLLLFAVYAFVFVAVLNSRFGGSPQETRTDYAIGLFLSLSLLQLFQDSMLGATTVVVQNPNFVKKVVFPLEILPVAIVGAAAVRFLASMILVLAAAAFWGRGLGLSALWLVPLSVSLLLLSMGTAWMLAAIGVFLRDTAAVVQFVSVLLVFTSATFYSFASVPAGFRFLRFNPLLVVVESSRTALLWNRAPGVVDFAYVGGAALLLFVLGYAFFRGVKSAFPDVL